MTVGGSADPAEPLAADRLAPPPDVAAHPAVVAARRLATETLAPAAQDVDVHGVPGSHVRAAAAAGLLGLGGPASAGGTELPPPVDREVTELLAGACGSTWLVLSQHRSPVRLVATSDNAALRERWLGPMCAGDVLAGTAFTHLRRPGPAPVRARRAGGGWVVDGTVDWFTGWGLSQVLLLGAQSDGGAVVFGLVDAVESEHLTPTGPLALAAMGGTHTTGLSLQALPIPADRVVAVVPRDGWVADDALRTVNATPAVFGLLRAVLAHLEEVGRRRGPEAVTLAQQLVDETLAVRDAAYRLADEVPPDEAVEQRLALRARSTELAVRASAAAVAAGAGRAMLLAHPAQRWAREALFHQVQAQTGAVRSAQLRGWGGPVGR
jgi:alkylation response protein AidB-like acyl-CoA dehydrogenase